MSATVFIEAGKAAASAHPDLFPAIGTGCVLLLAAGLAALASISRRLQEKPAPSRDEQLPTPAAGSDPWERLKTACAAGSAGVVKRRDRLKLSTTNALRQALDGLTEEQRAKARDHGFDWTWRA